jgi:hypothetical protein
LIVEDHKTASLAYFYCRDQENKKNTLTDVAKAIIAQLLSKNASILPYIYDECLKSGKVTLESEKECKRILSTVILAVPQAFIVIDGIDECIRRERKSIITFFTAALETNLTEPGKLRVAFISQDLGDIEESLNSNSERTPEILRLGADHIKQDVELYAIKKANEIQQKLPDLPNQARDHIVELVCEGADGMFLFAKLVLENLSDQANLQDLYNELQPDIFPNGFEQA